MSLPSAKNAMHRAIEALYCRPLNKQERIASGNTSARAVPTVRKKLVVNIGTVS